MSDVLGVAAIDFGDASAGNEPSVDDDNDNETNKGEGDVLSPNVVGFGDIGADNEVTIDDNNDNKIDDGDSDDK